ncbi:MAG: Fic family protein [Mycoplasmataceae bacterium]|nr:Fic family protein [Mycoplasmataceae bacterium]
MDKISIRFFDNKEVRAIWHNNMWYFSIVDVIKILNNEDNYKKASNYWRWLKRKMIASDNEFVSATHKLKMVADDNKKYNTDVIDSDGIVKLVKQFPNNKSIKFLDWFLYDDNSIDGQSKKKAYALFENNLVTKNEIGTTRALQKIHAFIFGGLYKFAGQIRKVNISKGGFKFALAQFLGNTLAQIDAMPENNFDEIVDKYIEMNIAHPFMEGNGRSMRIWLDLIFKKNIKKCVDWSKINKRDYLNAMIISHTNTKSIKALLKNALTSKINNREIFMKGIDYSYYYEQN